MIEGIKADKSDGKHIGVNDLLTERIIGIFYEVYNELGFGFLESVYREAMRIALTQAGIKVDAEVPVPVHFRGTIVGVFRADLIVDSRVILELKTAELISKAHEAQVLHYLRASAMEIGLVMNFGPEAKFRRIEMRNDRKKRICMEVPERCEGVGR